MIHLRVVAPRRCADRALELLENSRAVVNVVRLRDAAHKPDGDLILCDVAREDASVVLSDLRELGIHHDGSIAIEEIDTALADAFEAAERAAPGQPSDAVVWEEVEARTSEKAELSVSFLAFMCVATVIAAVGLLTDNPVLIVGSMVVGPEFGPLAGVCVALIHRRGPLARRSAAALGVGFPLAIAAAFLASIAFREIGLAPADFATADHPLTDFVAQPDAFSFVVAYLAGTAGVLSLTSAKSSALIGVLISVTTIPAAANVGLASAYGDWGDAGGALAQLTLNLGAIVLAGIATLYVQRRFYLTRKRRHERGLERPGPRAGGAGGGRIGSARPGSAAVGDGGGERSLRAAEERPQRQGAP